jgi:HAE1 family hydrophobic/amphiphilic exporter-1
MNLSAPFIERPVMTTLLMIAILVLGTTAYNRLAVSDMPDVDYPVITVSVPFPGANPSIMANSVATPLEKEFMTIAGVKSVTSSNTLGSTTIVLQFDIDKDIDLMAVDVDAAIVRARSKLPPDLPQEPTYKKANPSATPIIYLAVTSPTVTQGELYDYANTFIGQRISSLDGVSEVQVYGSPKAVRIQINPDVAASLGISMQEIATAIGNENQYLPLGVFDGTYTSYTIFDTGALYKAVDYNSIIIAYRNGSPIRVSDIGHATDSIQNDRSTRRYVDHKLNQPSVILAIKRQAGANVVKVADTIQAILPSLQKQLPGAIDLIVIFDRSHSIRASILDVKLTLMVAFILVVLVIFLYLGKLRDTIIPSVAMPMSVIATFGVMYLLGYTIDNLSLLALTLSIGFIVDDAIVVLENIVRRIEEGQSPLQASLEGSQQIGFTIVSMTLSLVAVFIPLIFMAGIIGKLFREFSITLAIVTIISGIISLTLTPLLCSRFLTSRKNETEGSVAPLSTRLNNRLLHSYEKGLKWTLRHPVIILLVGLASVVLSVLFFKVLPTDFIPEEDIGFVIAYTEAIQGTSSEQMNIYQAEIANVLRKEPYIQSLTSIGASPQYRQGLIFTQLTPADGRKSSLEIIQELNKKLKTIPGVNVYLKNMPLIDLNIGVQVRGAYQYLLQSLNSADLYKAAEVLIEKMRNDPLFQGISSDLEIKTPQLKLHIQRDHAATLGIDVQSFERSLFLGLSGNRISRIQTPLDQYDVIMEFNRDLQRHPASLNLIYLPSKTTNELVPLSSVANWVEEAGPASINHFAQFPAVTITFNIAPGVALGDAIARLHKLAATSIPSTSKVTGDVKGAAETFRESFNSLGWLLVITIFTIYIVLGILYESFIHPLTILSTLPPAILGALLTLYVTGEPLSLYAYLGIILLIGIVKKNGIMIVDFALENIRKGEDAEQSILDACLVRFRPIMMTTIAAIVGAIPLALGIGTGAAARRPLGYVIIGGMCVSQLITLFLTPVIYLAFERARERFNKKRQIANS